MSKRGRILTTILVLLIFGVFLNTLSQAQLPRLINYQGKLSGVNGPITVTDGVTIDFAIYDAPTMGTLLWTESHTDVEVKNGLFNVLLGTLTPIPDDVLASGERYLEITVNGETMNSRQQIVSVLFALKSNDTERLQGHPASDFAIADNVVNSLNTLTEDVTLAAGANVSITPSGNTLTISATAGSGSGDGYSLDAADGDPADVVFVDDEGKVGIGTTQPTKPLDVQGEMRLWRDAPASFTRFRLENLNGADPDQSYNLVLYGTQASRIARLELNEVDRYGLTIGSVERLSVLANGNVGVGTENPNFGLEVFGDIGMYTLPALRLADFGYSPNWKALVLGGTSNEALTISFGYDPSNNPSGNYGGHGSELLFRNRVLFKQPDSDDSDFLNTLTLDNGNVGIGIIDPVHRLDVAGTVHSSNGGFVFPDGSAQTTAGWTSGNDGPGSGLDADLLDGKNSTDFLALAGDGKLYEPLILASELNVEGGLNVENGLLNIGNGTQTVAYMQGSGDDLLIQQQRGGKIKIGGGEILIAGSASSFHVDKGYAYFGNAVYIQDQSGNQVILSADAGGLYIQVPGKAVRINGDFQATGAKNAIVDTRTFGTRSLYSDESTEVYFFDRGDGQLINGQATIRLDPVFLETVTIDTDHPMRVQVTPTADCKGLYVMNKTAANFTVKELMDGSSNATFDWEAAAKRRGYEGVRLEESLGMVTQR